MVSGCCVFFKKESSRTVFLLILMFICNQVIAKSKLDGYLSLPVQYFEGFWNKEKPHFSPAQPQCHFVFPIARISGLIHPGRKHYLKIIPDPVIAILI